MKVLYAEDERQLSAAICEILKIEGFDVVAVYDGQEAISAISTDTFDAVVLDIMMPKADGFEVLSSIRSRNLNVPVIMLTAKTTVEDKIEGLGLGADDYLCKPFAAKELVARLSAMMRRNSEYRYERTSFGNVVLDGHTGVMSTDTSSLRISNAESDLLAFFMRQSGKFKEEAEIEKEALSCEAKKGKARLYVSYLETKLAQIGADIVFEYDGKSSWRLVDKHTS